MSFSVDVSKWAEKTGEDMSEANGNIIMALFTGVILDTPVLEGRLRNNWIPTEGKPSSTTLDAPDPSGGAAIARAQKAVNIMDKEKEFSVYLTNNLPYAHRIEYDGWSHTKAPAGMVRKNLNRIASKI